VELRFKVLGKGKITGFLERSTYVIKGGGVTSIGPSELCMRRRTHDSSKKSGF